MNINENWKTDNLLVRRAVPEDIKDLNSICASWDNKIFIEGEAFPEDYIQNCIQNGDMPPIENSDISNYYFMVIQDVQGSIIGFFDLYHGYPDFETVWISMFLINKTNQGNSLGKEVINTLCTEIKSAGWKSIGLGVHLKNWKGLRFWKNNGFNRILEIYGDKEYDESTYSIIALKKEL